MEEVLTAERRTLRQAFKPFPWVKERENRKSRWKDRNKWVGRIIKDLEVKSWPFKTDTNDRYQWSWDFVLRSVSPGSPFSNLWATDYCITSVQTSFLRCVFISNGQNLSLKLQLWNWTWYLCLQPPVWISRLGRVIGSCCTMKVKDNNFEHKCGMKFCLYSKREIQQAMLVH